MGKKRKADFDRTAVKCEHPDGGTIHIRPMDADDAVRYADVLTRREFVRDDKTGEIVFSPKNGEALQKSAVTLHDRIEYAETLTERFEDFEIEGVEGDVVFVRKNGEWTAVDAAGEELEALPAGRGKTTTPDKAVSGFLKLMGTSVFTEEVDLDSDGKEFTGAKGQVNSGKRGTVTRNVRENYYEWVVREAVRLGKAKQEIERKNS